MTSRSTVRTLLAHVLLAIVSLFFLATLHGVTAQESGKLFAAKNDPKLNRRRGSYLLQRIKEVLKAEYYDPTFRGIDINQRFKIAEDQIKTQDFNWQIFRSIAQVLAELKDSHTIFFPPDRAFRVEYGISTMIIGNDCFVVDVKKGSDAESKGIRPGGQIISFSGIPATRDNYPYVNYIIYGLDPQESLKLQMVGVDGKQHDIEIRSRFLSPEERKAERKKLKAEEQARPFTCKEMNSELIACKFRTFDIGTEPVDKMIKEIGTRKKLILDLRGNSGGRLSTLAYLTGYFFQENVLMGTEKGRNRSKDQFAKGRKETAFSGELAVLIDSESASASEVLARVIQLQKRGHVYGDTSAGAVMAAVSFGIPVPLNEAASAVNSANYSDAYYISFLEVTVGDLIMSDGGRLEGTGVVPDRRIGPNPLALSKRTDPVLAFVASEFGAQMSPEAAGEFNFLIPRREEQKDGDGEDAVKK
jgi:C-terminal processing protease CtpA/Prc